MPKPVSFGAIDEAIARRTAAASSQTPIKRRKAGPAPTTLSADQVLRTRDLYWQNVLREMLNGLSVMSLNQPELFDGRFAVLTHAGERIAVGSIFPLFACSIPGTPWELEASVAVQCTVFRIVTPEGEVYTLPVHEVRGLHSLTPQLVEQLQNAAEREAGQAGSDDGESGEESPRPFGLAAFTSMPHPPVPPFGPQGPENRS